MNRRVALCFALFAFVVIRAVALEAISRTATLPSAPAPQEPNSGSWYFAVSGDSRNCGDMGNCPRPEFGTCIVMWTAGTG